MKNIILKKLWIHWTLRHIPSTSLLKPGNSLQKSYIFFQGLLPYVIFTTKCFMYWCRPRCKTLLFSHVFVNHWRKFEVWCWGHIPVLSYSSEVVCKLSVSAVEVVWRTPILQPFFSPSFQDWKYAKIGVFLIEYFKCHLDTALLTSE